MEVPLCKYKEKKCFVNENAPRIRHRKIKFPLHDYSCHGNLGKFQDNRSGYQKFFRRLLDSFMMSIYFIAMHSCLSGAGSSEKMCYAGRFSEKAECWNKAELIVNNADSVRCSP